jgi:type I restriction enzyme, S subunit
MNAKQLLAHFDRLAETQGAVPQLRCFILDLAVRGKLVEQDFADEPAAELLDRIRAAKAPLNKSGKQKIGTGAAKSADTEPHFVLPPNWVWAQLGEVAQYGIANKVEPNVAIPASTWVLDLEDIEKDTSRLLNRVESVDRPFNSAKTAFKQGDVLFGKLRPYLNKVIVADRDGVCTTEIVPIRGYCGLNPDYTRLVLRSPTTMATVDRLMYGMKMPRLGTADATSLSYPLPPLAEQGRIVAKVDELMATCDQLEAAQQERERRRDCLVAASLQRLNQPAANTTPEVQQEHVRFYLDHLFRLTTRPDHIKELRQTIFSLAVRGLLVEQDGTEEPAAAALKTIRQEKAQLAKVGTIPKEKTAPGTALLPFPLPENWQAVHLGEVCNFVTSGSRGWAAFYAESGPRFLRAQNIRFGRMRLDDIACVTPPATTEGARTQVQIGDLLIVITGAGVTNPALLESDLGEAYVSQHVALVRPTKTAMSKWLLLCLMSGPGGRNELV